MTEDQLAVVKQADTVSGAGKIGGEFAGLRQGWIIRCHGSVDTVNGIEADIGRINRGQAGAGAQLIFQPVGCAICISDETLANQKGIALQYLQFLPVTGLMAVPDHEAQRGAEDHERQNQNRFQRPRRSHLGPASLILAICPAKRCQRLGSRRRFKRSRTIRSNACTRVNEAESVVNPKPGSQYPWRSWTGRPPGGAPARSWHWRGLSVPAFSLARNWSAGARPGRD